MNERTECEKHIASLFQNLPHIAKDSILLMDRGYPSQELFEKFCNSGMKFVARCKSGFLSAVNNAPLGDSIVTIKNGVVLRIIKFKLSTGEIETLATNLFDIPEALFPDLYTLRWGIDTDSSLRLEKFRPTNPSRCGIFLPDLNWNQYETAYFRFKQELCVEKFSGKTANSIYQDFWASMVLLNSVAVFQQEADTVVTQRQITKHLKHQHRARTSDLIVTLRDRFVFAVLYNKPIFSDLEIERIIHTMARAVTPVRPGRSFPRHRKPFLNVNHQLKSRL
jgi:hypothetical protein